MGEDSLDKISYNYKIWLELDNKPLLGQGRYTLLKNIKKTHSLKKSAVLSGISPKTAYNYIRKIEQRLGQKIILTSKGGSKGGASITLNELGEELIRKFESVEKKLK